ncbi:FKBP-type peptidyl-prolyl cis-trans isomerase [Bacteroidota bacterium]
MYRLLIFFLILSFSACKYFSKYPQYNKTPTGIYYRLIYLGAEEKFPKPGNFITVDICYQTINDSTFFKGSRTFRVTMPEFKGAIDECFLLMSEGDSTHFIISADDFFQKTLRSKLPGFIAPQSEMKISIKMRLIRTEEEYQREKEEFLVWIEDFGDYEKLILKRFIEDEKIGIDPTENGIYYIQLEKGNERKVRKGDVVLIDYEGKFLNGLFFDSTKKRNQAFEFVYGNELQVIEGLESAIGMMHEGEKAIVIIPSPLAFGETGSSNGTIPPFTTVIYEIELLKIYTKEEIKNNQ